jgi:hypothetical protein
MDALVVKPFEAAASSSTGGVDLMNPRPKVIVLDGLDECSDPESQQYIVTGLLIGWISSLESHLAGKRLRLLRWTPFTSHLNVGF